MPKTRTPIVTKAPEASVAPLAMPTALGRIGRALVFLAIIVAPLLVLRPGEGLQNGLDTPRRLALFLCAGLMAALIVLSWAWRRRIVWRWHPLDLPVGLYALAALVSSLSSAYPFISLWGPLWSQDSILLSYTMILLYMGVKTFLCEPGDAQRAMTVLLVTGGIVAIIGLTDYLCIANMPNYHPLNPNFTPMFSRFRLVATFGNSMFTGTYFAVLIPLGVALALAATTTKRRILLISIIVLMLPALLLTQARAAWIALALTILLLLLMIRYIPGKHHAVTRIAWGIFGLCLVLALIIGVGVPSIRARIISVFNIEDATTQTRKVYMTGAFRAFQARPIQGWGVGTVRTIFPQFRPASTAREQGMALDTAYSTAHPHNLLLEIGAEMGLLGLAAFAFILIALVRILQRAVTNVSETTWPVVGLMGMLTAYLIADMMAFDNAGTMSVFWFGLGILAALTAQDATLSPRLGGFAKPLSAASVRGLTIAALVIALGTLLHVGMEGAASRLVLQAKRNVEIGNQIKKVLDRNDPPIPDAERVEDMKAAYLQYQAAERDLQASLPFTIVPDLHQGVSVGDLLIYETWCESSIQQMRMFRQDYLPMANVRDAGAMRAIYGTAHAHLAKYAQDGLHMVNREGQLLRSLEQMNAIDAHVGLAMMQALGRIQNPKADNAWRGNKAIVDDATNHAREIIQQLRTYEPRSAEIELMDAEIYGMQGDASTDPNQAYDNYCEAEVHAHVAADIDPTSPLAFANLALYQYRQIPFAGPNMPRLVQDICYNFGRAEELNPMNVESMRVQLSPDDLYAYTNCLFQYWLDPHCQYDRMSVDDAFSQAIAHGKMLPPMLRDKLRQNILASCQHAHRSAADMTKIQRALAPVTEAKLTNTTPSKPVKPNFTPGH